MDQDVVFATADLVHRAGAQEFEVGYLNDDPSIPDWYATATYRGAKLIAEGHPDPAAACDALARRLLEGARCRCGALVALSDTAAFAFHEAHLADGTTWTAEQAAAAGQCRWRRMGERWEPGCDTREPNRATRRQQRKGNR